MGRHTRVWVVVGAALAALVASAAPASAQRDFEPLFDKFNVRLEGSWVNLKTEFRLDSELLGRGTTLSFEDDLNLGDQEAVPTLAFDWQIARRHKLGVRWQDIGRDSNAQALEEIRFGDEVIPIDADISLGFDITQYFVDYTYYPWVKDRWAAGFGFGVRVMEISTSLVWEEQNLGTGGTSGAEGTGPLPYFYFEYRRLLSDHWRFKGGLGWLQVKIDDIDGSQWVARADIEYLLGRHWGFGAAINIATVDVDWAGVDTSEGVSALNAAINMDVNDVSLFVRFRF